MLVLMDTFHNELGYQAHSWGRSVRKFGLPALERPSIDALADAVLTKRQLTAPCINLIKRHEVVIQWSHNLLTAHGHIPSDAISLLLQVSNSVQHS